MGTYKNHDGLVVDVKGTAPACPGRAAPAQEDLSSLHISQAPRLS